MAEKNSLEGLNCPRCGGTVPVPEGQEIVICPFCDLRSVVHGEHGVRRYQVPCKVSQEQAVQTFRSFLSGNMSIASSAAREAKLGQAVLIYLPFWAFWGRAMGWVLGQKEVQHGKHTRHEPREVKITEDMSWNAAACEVGEFGVNRISLVGRPLEPFKSDLLHSSGMVFEPVGSEQEARQSARQFFEMAIQQRADLDQVSQSFVRVVRQRLGIVYYPLWVMRYTYRGRAFQVVVDGFSGETLYGKAPGNAIFRAGVLVGGMAAGAFIGVDISAAILGAGRHSDNTIAGAFIAFAIGVTLMVSSYRKFRYGEHYEFQRYKDPSAISGGFLGRGSMVRRLTRAMGSGDIEDILR